MATGWQERRGKAALDAVARDCARDLAPAGRVAERLRTVVASGADGWMFLDPQTLMFTGGIRPDRPPEVLSRLLENEFRQPDAVKFRGLARSPHPVGALWQATGGRPEGSPRYRSILLLLCPRGRPGRGAGAKSRRHGGGQDPGGRAAAAAGRPGRL